MLKVNNAVNQHNWVTFYNPRNGQIRIQACTHCGVAKGLGLAIKKCIAKPLSENKMIKAGWQARRLTA